MMRFWMMAVTAGVLGGAAMAQGQAGGAATPPMGWNSWNHFAGKVTDADVRSAADMMVSTGMRDAGYVYVNVDDTWQGTRDAQGVIHSNERFPDMKALADYVHSKGLKFGIYSGPGAQTCARFEGSLGHEAQDAATYVTWGVDFLKYDLCSMQNDMRKVRDVHPNEPDAEYKLMIDAYTKMGKALTAAGKSSGRPIVYSLCQYGVYEPWKWGPGLGAAMWRTTDDINDTFSRMMLIAYGQVGLAKYAGPGHWNDPDMLEIGNGKMTTDEYKTHMSLWVVLAAPLLAGNDLSKMSDADRAILTNREAIAIDQDSLGKQGDRVWQAGDMSVWTKPLSGGRMALAIVNAANTRDVFGGPSARWACRTGARLHEVWTGKDLPAGTRVINHTIARHGVELYVVSR